MDIEEAVSANNEKEAVAQVAATIEVTVMKCKQHIIEMHYMRIGYLCKYILVLTVVNCYSLQKVIFLPSHIRAGGLKI